MPPRYQGLLSAALRQRMAQQPEPDIVPGTGLLSSLADWGRRVQAGPDVTTIPQAFGAILQQSQGGPPVDPALMERAMNIGMGFAPFGMTRILPKKLASGLLGEPGYAYHATNAERLEDIARSGKLKTNKPSYGTDQRAWPDGTIEKRSYFGAGPEDLWQFAPQEGVPVVVRTKRTGEIFTESTGDLFARKPINAKNLEYLGDDNSWHSVLDLLKGQ